MNRPCLARLALCAVAGCLPSCGGASAGPAPTGSADAAVGDGAPIDSGAAAADAETDARGSAGPVPTCGAYVSGDTLHVCTATYLAGPGGDHLTAIDIGADGSIISGGVYTGDTHGAKMVSLLGGGAGSILRLGMGGTSVVSITHLGASVVDLHVDPGSGRIAVGADFGIAVLDATAASVLWHQAIPGVSRVAIGSDGSVAALTGAQVSVYDSSGAVLGSFPVAGSAVNDIVIDGVGASVIATGYRQDNGGACSQYKSTFIRAYSYGGTLKWKDYDWTHDDVGASGDCADTTGLRLAMGRDGKLYYAAKSDGGNTVHGKDPRSLSSSAPNVKSDAYNDPYGLKGANAIGYYARFEPATGLVDHGQFVLARNGTAGNAAVPSAIAADEKGNVYVAGDSAYEIENHDKKTIDGVAVGPYVAYEAFALIVSPDLSRRMTWTVFTQKGPANASAIAAGRGVVGFGAEQASHQTSTGLLITERALQTTPPAGVSAPFLSVWPAPP